MSVKTRERRLQELRQQAETLLTEKIKDVKQVKYDDVKEIIYELQVHQIELEMQNDELRRIQAELQESQNKYLGLYNSAPTAYFTLDSNGVILDVNTTGTELCGIEKPKLLMTKFTHLISPDYQDTFYFHCKKLFKTGSRQNCEIRLLETDGSPRYAHLESTIVRNISDNLNQHRMIVLDITERKQAENELRKFKTISDKAGYGISIIDLKGNNSYVNTSFASMHGFTPNEVIGKHYSIFHTEQQMKNMSKLTKKLHLEGSYIATEVWHKRKDGIEFPTLMNGTLIRDENQTPLFLAATAIDITERKRAEEEAREIETLKHIERLRTELLANISHELRSPLTSIKGFSTMLLEYDKRLSDKDKRKFLKTIDLSTDRLLELIDQLLDMSRLDAGILKIENKPTNINKVMRDAVNEAQVSSATHRLQLDLPRNLPRLSIDARRIRQVLENLISNAVKYSKPNTEIKIAAHCDDHELLISVADEGMGIPQEELPRVFDRFFRSQKGQVEGIQGVGLGLSICKRLVEAEGGRIWMESEEGKGSICSFSLPINIVPGDNDAPES
jgi:PAS domain S-box-containing protein